MSCEPSSTTRDLLGRLRGLSRVLQRPVSLASVGVGLLFLAIAGLFWNWAGREGWFDSPTYGEIYTDSPEIYTRERLVNDRFREDAWLTSQLEGTSALVPHITELVTESRRSRLTAQGSISQGNGASAAAETGPRPDAQSAVATSPAGGQQVSLAISALTAFELTNLYREELRRRIIENQLDDRHDRRGNSLYLLKFDTTIVPGARTTNKVRVIVKITGQPNLPEAFRSKDNELNKSNNVKNYLAMRKDEIHLWKKLYNEWAESSKKRLNYALFRLKNAYDNDAFSLSMYIDYLKYIGKVKEISRQTGFEPFSLQIKEIWLSGRKFDKGKTLPPAGTQTAAQEIDDQIDCTRRSAHKIIKNVIRHIIDEDVTAWRNINLTTFTKCDKSRHQLADQQNQKKDNIRLALNEEIIAKKSNIKKSDVNLIDIFYRFAATRAVKYTFGSDVGCRIVFQSSDIKNRYEKKEISDFQDSDTEKYVDSIFVPGRFPLDSYINLSLNTMSGDRFSRTKANDAPKFTLSKPTLDFIFVNKDKLKENHLRHLVNDSKRYQFLGLFGDDEAVYQDIRREGQIPVPADVIEPVVGALSKMISDGKINFENNSGIIRQFKGNDVRLYSIDWYLIHFLKEISELDTYTYAVTPRQSFEMGLFENLFSTLISGNAAGASGAGNVSLGASAERTTGSKRLQRRVEIVGFGSARKSSATEDAAATFGWVFSPTGSFGGGGRRLFQPTHKSLSALISVPAWWPKAVVTVTSEWLDDEGNPIPRTGVLGQPRSVATSSTYIVALPVDYSAIDEIMFEAVGRGPEIDPIGPRRLRLTACRPAHILIRGKRLWRSARVTVGGQSAKRITVLPNMKGLIAHFESVDVPPEAVLEQQAAAGVKVPVSVWTSEGVADFEEFAEIRVPRYLTTSASPNGECSVPSSKRQPDTSNAPASR